jgi:hypothetical protein
MNNVKTNVEPQEDIVSKNDLITPTVEEVKKQELITVLATLIKNYASKKKN